MTGPHRPRLPRPPEQGPRPGRASRGFTLLELLTVLMVMGTMGRVAVPSVHDLVLQARAQEVAARLDVIHMAAVDHRQTEGVWPADEWTGSVPPGLAPHLPDAFRFQGEGYRLDWERWELPDGLPGDPGPGIVVAVSVVTGDEALGQAVVELLDGALPHYVLDDRYTFVLFRR